MLLDVPWRLKPDDGPQIRPSRHNFKDSPNASLEPTSSMASTESRHGNSTGLSSANDLGPGTRSPAAVQTLCWAISKKHVREDQHIPQTCYRRLGVLEVLTKSCACA